jgi:dUTP pyrophosphatase
MNMLFRNMIKNSITMSEQALNEFKNLKTSLHELAAGAPATMSEGCINSTQKNTIYMDTSWKSYLLIEKLDQMAILPTKNNNMDAGYDLYAFDNCVVPAWGKAIVSTKIAVGLPPGTYGRVASRSGLSTKNDIEVGAGVIDRGYTGELKIVLRNFSDINYEVSRGDKIAQLILEQHKNCLIKEVSSITDIMGKLIRGDAGFGSSGK